MHAAGPESRAHSAAASSKHITSQRITDTQTPATTIIHQLQHIDHSFKAHHYQRSLNPPTPTYSCTKWMFVGCKQSWNLQGSPPDARCSVCKVCITSAPLYAFCSALHDPPGASHWSHTAPCLRAPVFTTSLTLSQFSSALDEALDAADTKLTPLTGCCCPPAAATSTALEAAAAAAVLMVMAGIAAVLSTSTFTASLWTDWESPEPLL
mmetsp:Transcript_29976/g.76324  ORF Transcript_29976/g.76324 Transcript_29976/m.76324 type:complete len:209 (-) Transcript_29976:1222-1848(-)